MPGTASLDTVLPAARSHRRAHIDSIAPGLFFAALWFILCRHLSNEWSVNDQYSYGWFVPFFAAYLFWLRWEHRPARSRIARSASCVAVASAFLLLLVLLPLRLFEVGNPDWRPLAWAHATIVVALTLIFVWHAGGLPWLRHFAFSICFIFVAVPWVTPIETPIVQGLMRVVAAIATEALALFGVPAQLEGSVIRINTGVVGVNEACSGVRSLQTSLMIGLLFGELKRMTLARRIALIAGAIAIAFLANCGRAFFLVWVAARDGVDAVEQWHDLAGYAILGAVFLGTMGLTALLTRRSGDTPVAVSQVRRSTEDGFATHRPAYKAGLLFFIAALTWLVFVEIGVEAWYRTHERNLVETPRWSVRWPEQAPGFQEVPIDENIAATLRYDEGRQARWRIALDRDATSSATPATCVMFFFRWEPGTTSILRARAHRPDVCLPNTGWRLIKDRGARTYPMPDGIALPIRHFVFSREIEGRTTATAHAFFCEREDRVPREIGDRIDVTTGSFGGWARSDRLRVVLEGLRNQGQQVLQIIIMAPGAVDAAEVETEFAKLIPRIVK